MDKVTFWRLVDASRHAAEGDPEVQIDELRAVLLELDEGDIVEFDRIFREYHNKAYAWDLWGAAYIIGGGCSDDGFMDFRGWLVSKGEKTYEAALGDAESLAKAVTEVDGECQIEGFLYAPLQAWQEKTGKSGDEFPRHNFGHPREPTGEPWEEEDLESRFPKLTKKFG